MEAFVRKIYDSELSSLFTEEPTILTCTECTFQTQFTNGLFFFLNSLNIDIIGTL